MNQFKHNYNNLAKTFFHNLSNEDKLKILNNEFDGKTRLAMEQIQRNHIQLAKAVGCLKI